jgi:GTP cyclohydrolase II
MPYIEKQYRREAQQTPLTVGELNYAITSVILSYLDITPMSYSTINDIIGALEGAKLEFYRRVAVPYEELKKEQNGDVY